MHRLPNPILRALAALATLLSAAASQAECPVGQVLKIDFDLPGSGYSEETGNWDTWKTDPCNPPGYRYLSSYVGDGTRKGKAIWKPAIAHAGHYRVRTGFRPTTNRTNDADYYIYDDSGAAQVHKQVDQSEGSTCTWADLGTSYCVPGGQCRVVLHGDDGKSDEADITTYELLDCTEQQDAGPPPAGRCDGIRANAAFEVCIETGTTCEGVFTNGAGCVAFCAAAGMTCTARYGGEPGCQKEAQNVLACADDNGHGSDWCACEGPPLPVDAGAAGSGGAAPGTGGAGGVGGEAEAGGASGAAGSSAPDASQSSGGSGAVAGAGGTSSGGYGAMAPGAEAGKAGGGFTEAGEEGGCGCHLDREGSGAGLAGLIASLGLSLLVRRSRRGRCAS